LTLLNPSSKILWKKSWWLKKRWAQGRLGTFFPSVHFKYFNSSCVVCICLFNDFSFAMVMLGLKLVSFTFWMFMNVLQVNGSKQKWKLQVLQHNTLKLKSHCSKLLPNWKLSPHHD
jgi:hypothetical protein